MKKPIVTLMTVTALMLGATAAVAAEVPIGSELAQLRAATAQFHQIDAALDAGYETFKIDDSTVGLGLPGDPTCFDNAAGGMGVHYVKGIDATLDPQQPEAMVYEIEANGRLRLVAVEYLVPVGEVDPANPPSLFGHEFHPHSFLPVYILHVWVWKNNPSGVFADFNPKVGACPG